MKNGTHCPSTDELIGYAGSRDEDREVEEHLRGCDECAAELSILVTLAGDGSGEREVSEAMISRIVAGLPGPGTARQPGPVTRLQLLLSWGLGFLTGLSSAAAGGSLSDIGPGRVLLLAAVFGLLCVLFGPGQTGRVRPAYRGLAGAGSRE
jgi:hypothetical protein